jgi:hypothetical protein
VEAVGAEGVGMEGRGGGCRAPIVFYAHDFDLCVYSRRNERET